MPLFQTSVLKKFLAGLNPARVQAAYAKFNEHFADPAKQENIRNAKEEQYQEGLKFCRISKRGKKAKDRLEPGRAGGVAGAFHAGAGSGAGFAAGD